MKRLLAICATAICAVALTGCSAAQVSEHVTVSGSTTCLPIAEIAAENFKQRTSTDVLVSGLGSSAGIEAVSNGTADIATSSRDLNDDERSLGLTPIPIAHDGIAIIVNTSNPVNRVTTEQLRRIYAGQITNWSELGGDDEPIQLVNRDEASGTREAFNTLVMKKVPFDRRAAVLPGTGQVRDVVSRSKGAIGYISMGFVKSSFADTEVKTLDVDGIKATEETVTSGVYPISRDLYFFVKGTPSEAARRYIDYMLSDQMDAMIREAGFIPMSASKDTGNEVS
ncbi:phosphate ABC transporter substrate-binding protein, PhoT family [Coriobacterium glomerans PW2]|uniref:Phosphate-binding protein n=1 Tax=Coriobacterium glomerans (strain ATCC 49209 / DSM 20642 / JCM 10262 / PW2) TaxID=700015 RepID=F2NBS3_CORGP|nr:phosphate ABC transporter substrate-binding protein [Coriobacterium glomerans]AEB06882.1 phosphate ABC transporter substrate-binding protein, PhoT family [Coriobacterium glomerans PW2]